MAVTKITEKQIGLSDVTTNDVSTSAHGLTPKAPNDATKYLDGTGAYSIPNNTINNPLMAQIFS